MTRFMYRWGKIMVRLRWLVLAIWIAAAAFIIVTAQGLGSDANNVVTLPGTGSQTAFDLLSDKFAPQQNGSSPIMFHVNSGKLTDPTNKKIITDVFRAINNAPHVYSAYNPVGDHGKLLKIISTDGTYGYIPVLLTTPSQNVTIPQAQALFDLTKPAQQAGMKVAAGGTIGSVLAGDVQDNSAIIGIIAAMIILALVFGSLVAMGVPILTALFGLSIGLSIITILSHGFTIPTVAPTLATMIGLGVGIDYALFMLTRHHDQLREGMDVRESIARATATSGAAIVFAGGTVVIAIASLAIARIPIVTALGYSTSIVVFVSIIAAITLLPAVLAIIGHGIMKARVPKFLRPKHSDPMEGIWAKWAHQVANHPVIAICLALGVLIPLMIPLFKLQFGQPDTSLDPTSQTQRQAYDMTDAGFGPGYNGPFLIAVELSPPATASTDYTTKKATAESLKHSLTHKQNHGNRTTRRLTNQKKRLEYKGKKLQKRAAPFTAREQALLARKAVLERRAAVLEAKGARLTARKTHLEDKATRLEAKLAHYKQQAETIANKIAHTTNPQKIARLTQRLVKIGKKALATGEQLKHLQTEGAHLATQAARLQRKGDQLTAQGNQLKAQGDQLTRETAPLERKKNQLTRQGDNLQRRGTNAKNKGKREKPKAKTQLARAKSLKHELTDMLKQAGGKAAGTDPRITMLQNALEAAPGVTEVSPASLNKSGTAAVISLVPDWAPSAPQTATLVTKLREDVIPTASSGEKMKVYVGGTTPSYVDLATLISARLPMIIAVVITLSFLLLMLAFRSIMIPLSAAVMNLLSVAASYGVLVMVFQWGWGASLLGYPGVHSIPIASYVPLMMFAVLFGLSMDYEVFLMSQITEHHSGGMNDHDSVVAGLAYSARVITAAAMIMVSVFASFILNSNPVVKQFGVGLSVAVAIDSTIVRILLVPATMTLLGDANWWLPKWLARILPRLNIEGTGFFDNKDGKPGVAAAKGTGTAAARA